MADNILYNFGANAGSLGDINGMLNNIQEVRQDISSIFTTLMSVYEGEGATARLGESRGLCPGAPIPQPSDPLSGLDKIARLAGGSRT